MSKQYDCSYKIVRGIRKGKACGRSATKFISGIHVCGTHHDKIKRAAAGF